MCALMIGSAASIFSRVTTTPSRSAARASERGGASARARRRGCAARRGGRRARVAADAAGAAARRARGAAAHRLIKYCSPKKQISSNLPPRLSKYEYTYSVPGGYCFQCDVLYESVHSSRLSKSSVSSFGAEPCAFWRRTRPMYATGSVVPSVTASFTASVRMSCSLYFSTYSVTSRAELTCSRAMT